MKQFVLYSSIVHECPEIVGIYDSKEQMEFGADKFVVELEKKRKQGYYSADQVDLYFTEFELNEPFPTTGWEPL